MKKPPASTQSAEDSLIEESQLAENDALWSLLGEGSQLQANPLFSRNVMREVRLSEQKPTSFWQLLFRPKHALGAAILGVLAIALLILASNLTPSSEGVAAGKSLDDVAESDETLASYLDEELLLVAADEPTLFSDESVIAMLF